MFDIWIGEVPLGAVVLALSLLVVLPLQLALCARASKAVRLAPALAALVCAVALGRCGWPRRGGRGRYLPSWRCGPCGYCWCAALPGPHGRCGQLCELPAAADRASARAGRQAG